ncbi:MAG: Various polyols ABC transporter, substrate-binding protein, partial [uncultured Phycisphaerae bacterium]
DARQRQDQGRREVSRRACRAGSARERGLLGGGRGRRGRRRPDHDHRGDRLQPADAGRDGPRRGVREGPSRHPREVRDAAGERGAGEDHGVGGHRGRRVRRRHDLELRDAPVGEERLAGEPAALRRPHPGLRPQGLHPVHPGVPLLRGRHVLRAVLRRVVLPDVPQGPLREGRARDARQADVAAGPRLRVQARRPRERHGGHLPARPAGVGRGPGAAEHRHQHLRGHLLRQELERQGRLAGDEAGGAVLRGPRPRLRRAGRRHQRLLGLRDELRPGQRRHVVRRHLGRRRGRGPQGVPRRREDGLRLRARGEDEGLGLAVHVVARHPEDVRREGRSVGVHVVDDLQGVPAARGGEVRLGAPASGLAAVHVRDPGIPRGGQGVRRAHAGLHPGGRPGRGDGRAHPVRRDPVPRDPRVAGPRHSDLPADQRRDRGARERRRGARAVPGLRRDPRGDLPM